MCYYDVMKVSELITLFPKKARKIPTTDVVRLLNGPVATDLYDMILAYAPSEYERKLQIDIVKDNPSDVFTYTFAEEPREVVSMFDYRYGEVYEGIASDNDPLPLTVELDGDILTVPANSPLSQLEIFYYKTIPTIADSSAELPYSTRVLSAVQMTLIYGVCLYYYRERKKAVEMQIYLDLYNEAKANRLQTMTVLSFHN